MIELVESASFKLRIRTLRDGVGVINVQTRSPSLAMPVGNGVNKMQIHHGSGYPVYFPREAGTAAVLSGGDKGAQQRDIERAGKLALE